MIDFSQHRLEECIITIGFHFTPCMAMCENVTNLSDGDEGASGIRRAITAVLAHPDFLYRNDEPAQPVEPGQIYALSDLQIASAFAGPAQ